MTDARQQILARIRAANHGEASLAAAQAQWSQLPRSYDRSSPLAHNGVLDLFEERLLDYDATVTRCSQAELTATVAAILQRTGVNSIGIAADLPAEAKAAHANFIVDTNLTNEQLNSIDAVLTTCACGIAQTGTLVLQNAPGQGRRALTLVPDVHICIVRSSQVVATVPEAFARLAPTSALPTTFVSGPSATADIEMIRVKGVHGPRFLHVVLVEDH